MEVSHAMKNLTVTTVITFNNLNTCILYPLQLVLYYHTI